MTSTGAKSAAGFSRTGIAKMIKITYDTFNIREDYIPEDPRLFVEQICRPAQDSEVIIAGSFADAVKLFTAWNQSSKKWRYAITKFDPCYVDVKAKEFQFYSEYGVNFAIRRERVKV